MYWLNLMAIVTLPDLTISMSNVDFETVQCGRCKVVTIRIKNPYSIKLVYVTTCLFYANTVYSGYY